MRRAKPSRVRIILRRAKGGVNRSTRRRTGTRSAVEGAAGSECERKVRASRAVCECVCLCDHLLRLPSVGGIRARSRHSAAAGGRGEITEGAREPGRGSAQTLACSTSGMQDVDFWLFQEFSWVAVTDESSTASTVPFKWQNIFQPRPRHRHRLEVPARHFVPLFEAFVQRKLA